MKKILGIVAAVSASLILAGCGGEPRIPANTVAAAYVDIDKAIFNVKDVVEVVIDELPKEMREEAEKAYEEAIEQYKKNFRCFDVEWAVATVGMDKSSPEPAPAIVVKADLKAKNEQGATLVDMVKGLVGGQESQVAGAPALTCVLPGLGRSTLAFVDDTYVIAVAASSAGVLERMVKLYKDGDGETSDAFDDLTDLDGDTVLRIQTADAATMADLFGCRREIEEFGEKCGDEDLAEMLLDVGGVMLDVKVTDDVLGSTLTVEAGSDLFADAVEGAANIAVLGNRIAAAGAGSSAEVIEKALRKVGTVEMGVLKKLGGSLGGLLRKAVEVKRSGSTVTLAVEFDTEDLVETIVPAMTGAAR